MAHRYKGSTWLVTVSQLILWADAAEHLPALPVVTLLVPHLPAAGLHPDEQH